MLLVGIDHVVYTKYGQPEMLMYGPAGGMVDVIVEVGTIATVAPDTSAEHISFRIDWDVYLYLHSAVVIEGVIAAVPMDMLALPPPGPSVPLAALVMRVLAASGPANEDMLSHRLTT